MASPSQPLSLSLSLDASLKPFLSSFLSGRHCHYFRSRHHQNLSPSSVRCSPQPQSPSTTTFLSPLSLSRLDTLSAFSRTHHFPFSYPFSEGEGPATLLIRPMLDTEIDAVAALLAESFIEILFFPPDYARLLAFLVKNYILDRRALLPHSAILVGILRGDGSDQQQEELACTAEISFDQRGSNASSPTPVPPPDCPYICNMTVKHSFRRKGIGKQLLKTCEDLITKMTDKRDVYLHCRMVDKVPLRMYKNAGYQPVKNDSILVWLTLQRRKYLMHKRLPDGIDSEAPKSEEL